MTSFLLWYLLVSIAGWLTFPLAFRLFPALADRGFALSRTASLLIWGYVFWLLASLGVAQNDSGGILLAFAFLIALSVWAFTNHKDEILNFLKSNSALVITVEILFLVAFAFMAFIRSANSELFSTEKPMELAFINGILRSGTFPPQDPWLSGYAISYYYFGYVMTAMLAKLTAVPGSMAHNLMTSLIFALAAVGAYGILYNLLSDRRQQTVDDKIVNLKSSIVNSLFAPLFLLLVSNLGAFLEVLHRFGIFWKKDSAGQSTSSFWTWLDVRELNLPPMEPFGWSVDVLRYLWWWRSSRIIQDYNMLGAWTGDVIDEFPFFSFLLGDLHPHVLSIPFTLLAIAVALNIFLGGWKGTFHVERLLRINLKPEGFVFSALVLGGLAFLNTWDILIATTLIVAAYIFVQAREEGWNWHRLEDVFLLGLPLGILSIFMYLPFYLGFSSQVGGILPSMMYPTRGAHLWVMWGTLLIPIYCLLAYLSSNQRQHSDSNHQAFNFLKPNWKLGFGLGIGFVFILFVFMWVVGIIANYVDHDFVTNFLASQGLDVSAFFFETSLRRLTYIGGLITMLVVLIPALAFLFPSPDYENNHKDKPASTIAFVMLLLTLGSILIIAPDFVYLRDQFGYRINTIFKFYYQAWVLWSLAASFGVAYVMQNLRSKFWTTPFYILTGLVVFIGLLYPALSLPTKTSDFNPYGGFTLDDFDRIKRENPDDAAGITWLQNAPDGVVVEAIGGSYDPSFARVATYTGLQNVLGWPGHESQWRGGGAPQGSRHDDVLIMYSTPDWDTAKTILEKYNVRYVYIGNTERAFMQVNEEKFIAHLKLVFQQGSVSIYEVP